MDNANGVNSANFSIAGWSVDPASLRISRDDSEVRLEPKAMAVLAYLAERPGQVVSRQELEDSVWAGTVVGYDAISNAIIKLRKAFGDDAHDPKIIETIPKTGYRLIAPVELRDTSAKAEAGNPEPSERQHQAPGSTPATQHGPAITGWKLGFTVTVPLAALVIVVLLWFQPWVPQFEPVSAGELDWPLPSKPSIAVMPFTNLTADEDYFVDGMTEDLIIALSKISGLFVVNRNSVFKYKGQEYTVREVAKALGVRYIAGGSMRRSGDEVRINVEVIDAFEGEIAWGGSFDGRMDALFNLQDSVARGIVEQFEIQLSQQDSESLNRAQAVATDVYELYLKGWGHYRAGGSQDYAKAIAFFQQALEIEPDFDRALAALAGTYQAIYLEGLWRESLGIGSAQAFELARKALRRSQQNPTALTHRVAAESIASFSSSPRRALIEAEASLELDPSDPAGHLAMASALLKASRPSEAELSVRTAIRFDPHFPPAYLLKLGMAQFQQGKYQDAIESLEGAASRSPEDSWVFTYLAAAYGHAGDSENARIALQQANELRAEGGWGPITRLASVHPRFRWIGKRNALKEGLTKAGAPNGGEWYSLIAQSDIGGYSTDSVPEVEGATIIDVAEAKALHDRGAVFIDTHYYRSERRIPGTHFLEWWYEGWEFNEVALAKLAARDGEIVLYSFDRSRRFVASPAALAVSRGFTKIHMFPGGTDAWDEAGYPLEAGFPEKR